MMGFGMFGGMFLLWVVLIALSVLLVRGLFHFNGLNRTELSLSAHEILEQRYARGEITQDQLNIMLKDIQ